MRFRVVLQPGAVTVTFRAACREALPQAVGGTFVGRRTTRENMATYVLVHGGAHGGWCYRRVAPFLREEGHDVFTPTLTGLGERAHLRTPDTDLDVHITDVVNVLHYEDLRDVILVGHSYGGMVITGTADRAPDRVGQLVYLDGALPENGESLVEMTPILMDTAYREARVVDGVELVLWPGPEAGRQYGVTDPTALAWMQDRLTPHPWRSFTQPLRLGDPAAVKRDPPHEHQLHGDVEPAAARTRRTARSRPTGSGRSTPATI